MKDRKKPEKRKAADTDIIIAFRATGGQLFKAAAWLRKNKGIPVSNRDVMRRVRFNRDLRSAIATEEKELRDTKKIRPVRKIKKSGPTYKTAEAGAEKAEQKIPEIRVFA